MSLRFVKALKRLRPHPKQSSSASASEEVATFANLLVHGVRSCFRHLDRTRDRLGSWLDGLQARMPRNKEVVALDAKMGRIGWVAPDQARSTLRTQRPCIRLMSLVRLQGSGIVMTKQWINMPQALKAGFVPEPFIWERRVRISSSWLAATAVHSQGSGYIYATGSVICDVAYPCAEEADHTFFPEGLSKRHCRASRLPGAVSASCSRLPASSAAWLRIRPCRRILAFHL